MKVCFLSSKHAPTDKRVFYKEARSLAAAGFDVIHLAPGKECSRTEDGVRLEVYRGGGTILDRFYSMFKLYRRAASLDADVYHCNEVDSWIVGVALKLCRKTKVVFDVHEHYPSTFARQHCPRWLSGMIGQLIRLGFRLLIPFTDYFVYAKRSVAEDFPNTEGRSLVVLNCTPLGRDTEGNPPVRRSNRDSVIVVHTGLIGRPRGWPQLFEALRLSKTPALRLKIIGECTDKSPSEFRRACAADDIKDRIEVYDWMPFEEMFRHVVDSDIGLVLFQPGFQNHVYAMPHKMFDYMKAGLPVIVPKFAVEVAPIVEEEQCGLLLDPSSPAAIADALDTLAADPALRARYGENGRRAVYRRYNWEREAKRLIDMYQRLRPGKLSL